MFKRIILLFLLTSINVFAQTGIGTTTPDASAKLEVSATNKGFLPPRVTLTSGTDNTTIPSPATGLLVYNTGNNAGLVAGYYYWNGTSWATIATASGSGVSSSFMRGSRSAGQTSNLTAGSLVAFSQVDNVSGQEISLNTSTGQITLAAGRTYRLIAQVPNFQTSSAESRPQFGWYNETNSAYIGSSSSAYGSASTASYGAFGGISEAIITTTTNTVISYRILQTFNMTQIGGNGDFSTTGAYPWFDIQVISGNTAVNGQSVDYVSVYRNSSQTLNTGDNIKFNVINAGNIPYDVSTGNFTLTANKTYRLSGNVTLSNGNTNPSEADIVWRTAAGTNLGNSGMILSMNHTTTAGGNGISDIIYTPTSNTTISLYVVWSSSNVTTQSNNVFANIEQIGSSAIVNPWTLAGTTTYNTTGNVGIGTNAPTAKLDVTGDVNVTGKLNVSDPTGSVATKVSGFVNAGNYIQMDNIKATVAVVNSYGGLSIAAVSTQFNALISGTFGMYNGSSGGSAANANQLITTTPTGKLFGWGFPTAGDASTYIITDNTNNRVYRITLQINYSFNYNFLSIERLL